MKPPDVLGEIIAKKRERINLAKQQLCLEDLKSRIQGLEPARRFIEAIDKPRKISLIAEIKKASPSCGVIRQDFDPVRIAGIYKQAGAQALSILTCEDYFMGDIDYLQQVRQAVDLPILRKDFIIEPYQIYESRAFGCDALLLIAGLLTQKALSEFLDLAHSLGLECLVETHTESDIKKALKAKAGLIGINNRDLHTLEVDIKTTQRLYPLIPKDKPVVVESGIKTYQDVLFLKILGVRAVLIGQAFMQARDINQTVNQVMGW